MHEAAPASGLELTAGAKQDAMLLSALLDGELSEIELSDWLSHAPDMDDAATQGQTYQFIGDALRGQPLLNAGTPSASAFLAGVQTRLHREAPLTAPTAPSVRSEGVGVAQLHAPAANDAVFRWKLVAGLASLGAVMAVSWNLLATAPTGSAPGVAAPQLALSQPLSEDGAAVRSVAVASPSAAPLVVNTRQGVLIRDAELEALMAEHRQHGGVSALQMPAGFLRNATYDPDAR